MLIIFELVVCVIIGLIGMAMGYSFWAVFLSCVCIGIVSTLVLGGIGVIDLGGDEGGGGFD